MSRRRSVEDIRLVAYRSVQLCLEVADGRRPPASLDAVAHPRAQGRLRDHVATVEQPPSRIRRIAIQHDDDRIDVTALIGGDSPQISAMTLQLRDHAGSWRICEVEHLQRGQHHLHPNADHEAPRMHTAAHDGIAKAVLGAAAAASEEQAKASATWSDRTAHLREARHLRALAEVMDKREPIPDLGRPPTYLVAMLGTPPNGEHDLAVWRQAAGMIGSYRRAWNITDPQLPFGAPTPKTAQHAEQHTDRSRTMAAIRALLARDRDVGRQPPTLEPPGP